MADAFGGDAFWRRGPAWWQEAGCEGQEQRTGTRRKVEGGQ